MEIKTLTNLGRFKDIVLTLLNYGFVDLVDRLDLPGKKLLPKSSRRELELGTWERIRRAMEDLGPTFVKFGQIMSLRPDLLPGPLIEELRKLQDEVPPEKPSDIRKVIEKALGSPLEQVFLSFETEPIAAASLSQVHRALLRDSRRVVAIKVQRPGIRSKIEKDLDILAYLLGRLNERVEEIRLYDLPGLLKTTRRNLLRELDFLREARAMQIARAQLSGMPGVYIPEPVSKYCTERLLVMDFVRGKKLKELPAEHIEEAENLAKLGLRITISQILEHGFFHADPHPGNLLVREGKELCLLDWGMVGRLTDQDRFDLIDLVRSVAEKDSKRLLDTLLLITSIEGTFDQRALERDLLDILDAYTSVPLQEINIGQALLDITALLREYRLRVPSDLAVMIKALVTAEGTARILYPDLNIIPEIEDQVRRLAVERYHPGFLWKNLRSTAGHLLSLHRNLPSHLSQIVDKVNRGDLSIRFEHENLGSLRKTLENIFNRLTLGVILAAMIIGSSMIITTGVKPFLFGYPALGVIGYIISGVLGLWLVFNILRTRRF
ncbi:ABC1 kinase family protein [Desulfatiglans anilini]|uniref:ABC1 kinase family protein n=1 Tax=Desulfatiglans anilini TaxID=90728 RepID=UPI0003F7C170|nr:AarF/UbiB family protein [Desulfatiglans anilini]